MPTKAELEAADGIELPDHQPRGVLAGVGLCRGGAVTTDELRRQAEEYAEQVRAAGREQPTVDTYLRHALFFVRWLAGDFEPGARLRGLLRR